MKRVGGRERAELDADPVEDGGKGRLSPSGAYGPCRILHPIGGGSSGQVLAITAAMSDSQLFPHRCGLGSVVAQAMASCVTRRRRRRVGRRRRNRSTEFVRRPSTMAVKVTSRVIDSWTSSKESRERCRSGSRVLTTNPPAAAAQSRKNRKAMERRPGMPSSYARSLRSVRSMLAPGEMSRARRCGPPRGVRDARS